MITRVFDYADRLTRDVMTPRTEIDWLEISADAAQIRKTRKAKKVQIS